MRAPAKYLHEAAAAYLQGFRREYSEPEAVAAAAPLAPSENGIYLPTTIAESTAIGGTLDVICTMQGPESPLVAVPDTAFNAVANGTLGYQQTIAGWARGFVNLPEVANNRVSVGNLVTPATESFVLLFLARLNAAGADGRQLAIMGAAGALFLRVNLDGTLNLNVATVQANGSVDYVTEALVRMYSLQWDVREAGAVRVETTLETVAGTPGAVGDLAPCRLGAAGGTSPPDVDVGWWGAARGVNAEALMDAVGGPLAVFSV